MKRTVDRVFVGALLGGALATQSLAGLLGVNPGFPKVTHNNANPTALHYDPVTQRLAVDSVPTLIQFASSEGPRIISGTKSLTVRAAVNNSGTLIGGVEGDDLVLTGTFTRTVGGVTTTYTGILLRGEVVAFGFNDSGATDNFDFRFVPTGGELRGFYEAGIALAIACEASSFTGDCTVPFSGRAKGTIGVEDAEPPTLVCPPELTAESNATLDGVTGAYVTFPTPTATDHVDPSPIIVCTPPSGSFFPFGPTVVTCVASDAVGNHAECTFTITVSDRTPPQWGDTENPIIDGCGEPMTLATDLDRCAATYRFPRPAALDNQGGAGVEVPVEVSAVDEFGATIPLAELPGGMLEGVFPRTVAVPNLITAIATDTAGNATRAQCAIRVQDLHPPTLACVDQTSTFKPTFTQAASSITARFNCLNIPGDRTIWFSSVINTPSDPRSPFTVRVTEQNIVLTVDGETVSIPVPDAFVTFTPDATVSTTTFADGGWQTVTRPFGWGSTFLSGVAYDVPYEFAGCRSGRCTASRCCGPRPPRPHRIQATWSGKFQVNKPGIVVRWQWAAATYSQFSFDYNALGVKPVDALHGSVYPDRLAAGTPEAFTQHVVPGARGDGRWGSYLERFTGDFTHNEKVNLGRGIVCQGPVAFETPTVTDNCEGPVTLVCTPASGTVLGPGDHVVTCVAHDADGNTSEGSFTLTVLAPLQLTFQCPPDDNLNDNTCQPDAGYSDMNCPDAPETPQIITRFGAGDWVPHRVRLLDCNGNDVTTSIASLVTVHIDVTEREGDYYRSDLVHDLEPSTLHVGGVGGLMIPQGGFFQYDLNTSGYTPGTVGTSRFFRSCVWVDYNAVPGVPVGMEDVILESD